jgi:phosphoribosyl-dephospho-CoA transferase
MSTEKSAFWRGIMIGGVFALLTSVAAGRLFDTRVVEVASIIPQDVSRRTTRAAPTRCVLTLCRQT